MSRLLDLARAVGTGRAGQPHNARGVPISPPVAARLEHEFQRRSALLAAAGDLVEEINAHLTACRVCRRDSYVTDTPGPLCDVGLELWRQYREARRAALSGESSTTTVLSGEVKP